MPNKSAAEKIPHSWSVEDWPPSVYPCRASKGRYILREYRDALVAAGALVRVGRDLVVIGPAYEKWLAKQASRVAGFEIAPNAPPVPESGSDGEHPARKGARISDNSAESGDDTALKLHAELHSDTNMSRNPVV
jgi:hypothetical protein